MSDRLQWFVAGIFLLSNGFTALWWYWTGVKEERKVWVGSANDTIMNSYGYYVFGVNYFSAHYVPRELIRAKLQNIIKESL